MEAIEFRLVSIGQNKRNGAERVRVLLVRGDGGLATTLPAAWPESECLIAEQLFRLKLCAFECNQPLHITVRLCF